MVKLKIPTKYVIFILFIVLAGSIFLTYYDKKGYCYEKNYILISQHIGTLDKNTTSSLIPCENCLILKVVDASYYYKRDKIYDDGVIQTLFFSTEHKLREDLIRKDKIISINWCNFNGQRLIRGVE